MMNGQFNSMQNPYMTQPYYANRNNPLVQNQNNRIVWVNGIEGAKAFQIEPNSNILLLDSDIQGRMYIKACDNIGMCNLRIFNYEEVVANTQSKQNTEIDTSNFVTKDEMNNAINEAIQLLKPKENEKSKGGKS